MKSYQSIVTITLILVAVLLPAPVDVSAAACPAVSSDTPLPFAEIQPWHEAGYCGGSRIGLFVDGFPIRSQVAQGTAEALGDLLLRDDQRQEWTRQTENARINGLLDALHQLAPISDVYLYHIGFASFDPLIFNADIFQEGLEWMRSEGVSIIVNTTTYPLYTDRDIAQLEQMMTTARDSGILWINSAGNFGNAFYRSTYSPGDEPWHHEFSPEVGSLLPFQVVNDGEVGVFFHWEPDHSQVSFELTVFSDNENLSANQVPSQYRPINTNRGVLRLMSLESERSEPYYFLLYLPNFEQATQQDVSFEIYFANAVLAGEGLASPSSIPPPNAFINALTVGAPPTDLPSGLQMRSGQSGVKPDLLIDGTLTAEQGISTGLAATRAAGVVAVYWSEGSPHAQKSVDQITDLLLNSRQSDGTLQVAGLPSLISRELIIISVIVVGAIGIGSYKYRRRQFESAMQQMQLSVEYQMEDKRLMFELKNVPLLMTWGRSSLREYTRKINIKSQFDPQLSSKTTLSSPLIGRQIIQEDGHKISAGLPSLLGSASGERNHSTVSNQSCLEAWGKRTEWVVSVETHCIEQFEEPAIKWSLDFDNPPAGRTNIHIAVNSFSPPRLLFSNAISVDFPAFVTHKSGGTISPTLRSVFVSYARKDNRRERIKNFVSSLEFESKNDLEFWFDERNIALGSTSWKTDIEKALREADVLLLFLSTHAMKSDYVREEIQLFQTFSSRKCIVPFQIDSNIDEHLIFDNIRTIQRVIYKPRNRREQLRKIIEALSKC